MGNWRRLERFALPQGIVRARIHFLVRRPERENFWSARSLRAAGTQNPRLVGEVLMGVTIDFTGSCGDLAGASRRLSSQSIPRAADSRIPSISGW